MSDRLTLVVLLYVHPGKASAFEAFETRVQSIMRRHGGRLESRIECAATATDPHEIQVVSFENEAGVAAYRSDPEYLSLAAARAEAIRETTIFAGTVAPNFQTPEAAAEPLRIIGLDHVYLSVTDMPRSEAFYDSVMAALGFRKGDKAIAGERHAHYFNPFLQVSIRPARSPEAHDSYRAGLHHLCLQAPDERAVNAAHAALEKLGVRATAPRKYAEYNPDYYATFFEDPDGIRLEIVARTPHRERVLRRWADFRVFVNPVAELLDI
jgi:glyoxylase I family protein